jgi:hypothetical protein
MSWLSGLLAPRQTAKSKRLNKINQQNDYVNRINAQEKGNYNQIYGGPGYRASTSGVSSAIAQHRQERGTKYGGASVRMPGAPSNQARIASTGSAIGDAVARARRGKQIAGGNANRRTRTRVG